MKDLLICSIPANSQTYAIEIGSKLLHQQINSLKKLSSQFAVITDTNVASLYGEPLQHQLTTAGLKAHLLTFPAGEEHKTRATKETLENQLFIKGYNRDCCLIALGGGIVNDITGYLAATYCRGIPFVSIPTTLLSMVDASIGGKTGVNTPHGKNLLGCIYQPKKVIIDLQTLKTLPAKELHHGFVEIIKHCLIADKQLFTFLEQNIEPLLALDFTILQKIVVESCRIKLSIIQQDEKEYGKRRLLNFGHTVGHALEHLTHYFLSHGEAVAIGILVESEIALLIGKLQVDLFDRLQLLFKNYGLSLCLPSQISIDDLINLMKMDKKSINGRPRFVIIDDIGSTADYEGDYCTTVDEKVIRKALIHVKSKLKALHSKVVVI